MRDNEITVGQTLWVALDQDDMYGAEAGTDNLIQARVTAIDAQYVSVADVESDDTFEVDASQCYATQDEARV